MKILFLILKKRAVMSSNLELIKYGKLKELRIENFSDFYNGKETKIGYNNNNFDNSFKASFIQQSSMTLKDLQKGYENLYRKLEKFNNLKKNWDGYQGVVPKKKILSTANFFLKLLQKTRVPFPEIMLAGNGMIGIFWENNLDYIEVSFDVKDKITFFSEISDVFYGEDDVTMYKIPYKLMKSFEVFFKTTFSVSHVESSSEEANYMIRKIENNKKENMDLTKMIKFKVSI